MEEVYLRMLEVGGGLVVEAVRTLAAALEEVVDSKWGAQLAVALEVVYPSGMLLQLRYLQQLTDHLDGI